MVTVSVPTRAMMMSGAIGAVAAIAISAFARTIGRSRRVLEASAVRRTIGTTIAGFAVIAHG
jgi:hypothetical protein